MWKGTDTDGGLVALDEPTPLPWALLLLVLLRALPLAALPLVQPDELELTEPTEPDGDGVGEREDGVP